MWKVRDGVGDVQPCVVCWESEVDGRRVTENDDGDADFAAVNVQLNNNVDKEVQQLTVLRLTDRRRIIHHEHHVHLLLTTCPPISSLSYFEHSPMQFHYPIVDVVIPVVGDVLRPF